MNKINLPFFLQKPIRFIYYSIPDKYRLGPVFRDTYEFLEKSQWWTEEKHNEYQLEETKRLIRHAYDTVPYYKKKFYDAGIIPNSIQDFDDIKKIPYLTKEDVRNNLDDLVSKDYNINKLKPIVTGGTTGIPIKIYVDGKYDLSREKAFVDHILKRVGYRADRYNKSAALRGDIIKDEIYEYKNRVLNLSSFKMTKYNIFKYIYLIEKFNPQFLYAYPSSISIISDYIIENKIDISAPNLKSVICASENIYDFQREKIEKAFKVRPFSFYGQTEHVSIGGECEKSSFYHMQSEYGYTEIINEKGEDASYEGEAGEIVSTGFSNYAMPFIRYKTGDIGIFTNEKCTCGRNYKLIKKVEGRESEYFIDKDGNRITFIRSDDALWGVSNKIFTFQYIQNEPGKVILEIVIKNEFGKYDLTLIKEGFRECYPQFDLEIKIVSSIERTERGKHMYLVQNIK